MALLFFSATLITNAAGPSFFRFIQAIPLPNVEGRIDHMSVDVEGQRLFIAALGNDSVEIVDLRAGETQSYSRQIPRASGCGMDS